MSNDDLQNPIANIVDSLHEYDTNTLAVGLITLASTSYAAHKGIIAAAAYIAAMSSNGADDEWIQNFHNLVKEAQKELEQEGLELNPAHIQL